MPCEVSERIRLRDAVTEAAALLTAAEKKVHFILIMLMYQEITYPSSDKKTTIHAYIWRPHGCVRGAVQIVHGMAEYALRYEQFANFLTARGFVVCAEDHLGHGKSVLSADDLGYFDGGDATDKVLADIHALSDIVRAETRNLPYFMLGHSMGSFFCRKYISLYGGELAGAVIMGTGFQPSVATGFGRLAATLVAAFKGWKHRSPFIDKLAFGAYNAKTDKRTPYDWLSAEKKNVDDYIADDLCGATFTCGGFKTLFSIVGQACSAKTIKSTPKNLPIYLVAGDGDPVGGYSKGVKKLYDKFIKAGISDVQMTIYRGARHEILNDFCAPQVMEDISSFALSHISAN